MFGIGKHVVDEDDSGLIKVAVLGNSKKVAQGDAVIALGNIFGYADGMSYGVVSASNYKATFFDGECAVIATDIPAEEQGTGMLFNMDGEVVGMISSSVWNEKCCECIWNFRFEADYRIAHQWEKRSIYRNLRNNGDGAACRRT